MDMVAPGWDGAPPDSMVKNWAAIFKGDRIAIGDEHRSGRPTEAATLEIVDQVPEVVMEDR